MRCAYISYVDTANKANGVLKKIEGQIEGLKENDVETDYIVFEGENLKCNNEIIKKVNYKKKHKGIFRELCRIKEIHWRKYDFVYIRFSYFNINLFKFIKYLNKQKVKIYLEIPTYPYKYEIKNYIKRYIIDIGDKILFYSNKKYIQKIITTSKENEIFGIETIKIFNGINKKNIVLEDKVRYKKEKINLVGMANLNYWHGYDRIIQGLGEIGNSKVDFYIIGEGPEKKNLQGLVEKLGVENKVIFLGEKSGLELDKILNNMDVAISSLGLHRIGGAGDPIKTKEFLAKGFPVILGYNDIAIKEEKKYIYKVKADESKIDINKIIRWYDENKFDGKEIIEFAMKNLGWDSQMMKIKRDYENKMQ